MSWGFKSHCSLQNKTFPALICSATSDHVMCACERVFKCVCVWGLFTTCTLSRQHFFRVFFLLLVLFLPRLQTTSLTQVQTDVFISQEFTANKAVVMHARTHTQRNKRRHTSQTQLHYLVIWNTKTLKFKSFLWSDEAAFLFFKSHILNVNASDVTFRMYWNKSGKNL